MIAGSEATRIKRALDSVSSWAAEIIVVLNEDVTDGTDKIAIGCGAKVFREPWKGHIAQKNSAAGKATQEWLFGLDADEEVTVALRTEVIRKLKALSPDPTVAAFSMPRCSFYCGRWLRHGDWYPDRKVRLWRKGAAVWAGKNPHDKLVVTGSVQRLRGDLLHYSMNSLEHHARKAVAYGKIFAEQYHANGSTIGAFSLWMRPAWRFMRSYIIRLGFLDGWQGFAVAKLIAFETFIRYAKVREIQQSKNSLARGNSST